MADNKNIFKVEYKKAPFYLKKFNPGLLDIFRYYLKTGILYKLFFLFITHPIVFFKRIFKRKTYKYEDIIKNIALNPQNSFISLSYCQKPNNCPYLKFSDKCFYDKEVCRNCFVGKVKKKAQALNINFHFSLTNLQVFDYILKPYFLKDGSIFYILNVCHIVSKPTKFISRFIDFHGIIFEFDKGFCPNLLFYDLAEHGKKNVQTFLTKANREKILKILDEIGKIKKDYV